MTRAADRGGSGKGRNELARETGVSKRDTSSSSNGDRVVGKSGESSGEFRRPTADADVYALVCRRAAELMPDLILAVSSYDAATDSYRIRAMHGVDAMRANITKLLGMDPLDFEGDFGPRAKRVLVTGKLARIENGLHDFRDEVLHSAVAQALEKLLGITGFYVVGLLTGGRQLGAITVVVRHLQELPDARRVEAFAQEASGEIFRRQSAL